MKAIDSNVEIARLQKDISKALELSMDNLVFDYTKENGFIRLELITINPKHEQSFLYHTVSGESKTDVLKTMLDYIQKNFRVEGSYTVQWAKRGTGELHTSYFRAHDIYEVLEKFSHGRDINEYTIFSINLNPIA